ncbi:cytoplasmic protein [Sutcliffiella horikoshii]|uniref:Cytoplasmic protein n=1 Tax=Sutcliffiella horikoshii TaxID=79883 RepID=A0A5D4TF38_9BACI|nr:cytoplasmic protein [Sutcliffiella horikoshii]TYS74247.1 cytoplasmic protein [Sutcliffiella horikoshii]
MEDYIANAHKLSSLQKKELVKDKKCGCFFCLEIYSPALITEWIDEGQTAICPHCGIDSVIGESSGYPITREFLEKMNQVWF